MNPAGSLSAGEQPLATSAHKPDWHALRLLNQYRLLIIMALAAVYYLADDQRTLGSINQSLFATAHFGYLIATISFVYYIRAQRPSVDIQFYLQNYIDILFIAAMMYTSGGVNSGLGSLLIVNLALLSQLSSVRTALQFAAIASMIILLQEMLLRITGPLHAANLEATALHGTLLFLVAWLMTVPLRQLVGRELALPTRSRAALDVSEIAQMNETIIRELDSGVVVADSSGSVQLINDTARVFLTAESAQLPLPLKSLSTELSRYLHEMRKSASVESRPVEITRSGYSVLPHIIPLSSGGVLIRLDDQANIRHQFQQLKLASLGKLSASIAHEIRNPLGAIQHAVQLIEESGTLSVSDQDLLAIARRQAQRINRIIEDVLQLSNRQSVRAERVLINELVARFASRFCSEYGLDRNKLELQLESPCWALVDPSHLDQILWNLCTNARLHNNNTFPKLYISCELNSDEKIVIHVIDDGRGIPEELRDTLFEPFCSTHHSGTGLGLYIVRELCVLNKAWIENIVSDKGAHFRITLSNAKQSTN